MPPDFGLRAEAGAELELLEERVVDQLPVPLRRIDFVVRVRRRDFLDQRVAHVEHVSLERGAAEQFAPAMVNHLALLVHDVVVFEQMLADVEVVRLDFLLRVFDRARYPSMLDGLVVLHPDSAHQALETVGAEDAEQVVLERHVESRRAGVALASRAAAQLVVDAARLVALGAEDVQAAGLEHLLALGLALFDVLRERSLEIRIGRVLGADFRRRHELGISAEHDIGAAAGHVGRNRDRAETAGLGDDFRFALMVLGVQHVMLDAGFFELFGDALGLFDRDRADQHRLAAFVAVADFLDHGVELLAFGFVNDVVIVDADHRLIGRNHDHVEAGKFP